MERIVTYDMKKSTRGFLFNSKTSKWEYEQKHTDIRICEQANDLRYCGYGVQAIWWISIEMPHSNITKTLRRKDSADFSKVEEYINKILRKNKFKQICVKTDAVKTASSPAEWNINHIKENQ
tara:strand:+ start:117 stop:482 length:366 start_codon:yes stop_codon:yes gene_type:complete